MNRRAARLVLPLALLVILLCLGSGSGTEETTNRHGIDPQNFDPGCEPCRDFYQFANGTWLERNSIPAEYGGWSTGHEVYERNNEILRGILEKTAQEAVAAPGSVEQKIGDFYRSAMNTQAIETAGADPLRADLERIGSIADIEDLQATIAAYHAEGLSFLFGLDIDQDLENSERVILYVGQGGLGLPDRDYYTREDEESAQLRAEYREHIAAMLHLLGDTEDTAGEQAQVILAMETRLARASLTSIELRDPSASYNVVTVGEAETLTPHFAWRRYFSTIGVHDLESFSYSHPEFFGEMNRLLTDIPLADWKSYVRFHLASSLAEFLSDDLFNEDFRFYGAILSGTEEPRPRWHRVLETTNDILGEALGQLYVRETFPPESKARALEMIANLRTALGDRIRQLEWMSDETKPEALKKLAAFGAKIGYPDRWRDYSALAIDGESYIGNVRRGFLFERRRQLDKIGRPVDRAEWEMNPQTVNAYYHPLKNEIVFPAAILQPPFFDGQIDDAINYGAMGAIIGHEMTHGFDDFGSQFDADGNLADWWTAADREAFEERTMVLVEQFNGYIAIDELHVNGELTLGENIADLGGLLVAYDALGRALAGTTPSPIDGYTQEQRFFLSHAQCWRAKFRPEALKLQVRTDPHSPAKFRNIGPLSNMEEFAAAFDCQAEDPMVRPTAERVTIW